MNDLKEMRRRVVEALLSNPAELDLLIKRLKDDHMVVHGTFDDEPEPEKKEIK